MISARPKTMALPLRLPLSRLLLVSLYLAAATAILALAAWRQGYDDPYITYRYARNLASGQGLVYNPGERVLSTTTPLFALLLAALSLLWGDLPHLALIIGALSLGLGALFLFDLARAWDAPWTGWAALLLYPTFPLLVGTLGSETPLYLALGIGAFAAYARRRYVWAASLSAFAVLARPDGVLVPALLALHFLIRRRELLPWKAVLAFLILSIPWFLFAWTYYGSPLPVTLAAKQGQGAMAISQSFAQGFLGQVQLYAADWTYWLAALLGLVGLFVAFLSKPAWLVFLSWPLLYFASYTLLGVSRYFWYYAPLVPGFVVLAGLGLDFLAGALPHRFRALGLLAALVITILAQPQARTLASLSRQRDPRLDIYREVGVWLNQNTAPTSRVGMLEVGVIGYYAQRPVVDFAGLIQPEVARRMHADTTYEDTAQYAIETYHPEYLLLHAGVFPALEQGYVSDHCEQVRRFPGAPFGYDKTLVIYRCNYIGARVTASELCEAVSTCVGTKRGIARTHSAPKSVKIPPANNHELHPHHHPRHPAHRAPGLRRRARLFHGDLPSGAISLRRHPARLRPG